MNMHSSYTPGASPAAQRVRHLFDAQAAAFQAEPFRAAHARRADLAALRKQIQRYQDRLAGAMSADFGFRSPAESKMLDLLGSILEIDHAYSHLKRWMRPSRRSTELLFKTNSLHVTYQPKGVVGIIVPWNFPVYLALGPLAAALAAGNRVMLKLSEATPHTNAVLRTMLEEVFRADHVGLIGEELEDARDFTCLPFNHLVFTGSPAVGRLVMAAAAAHLTPVTLELGGKSPALLCRGYPVEEAARRIAHGKAANSGQVCVAPDYALVPRESVHAFAENVEAAFRGVYGEAADSHDYTAIVNDRHHARLQDLLADARARGAQVISCGRQGADRKMPLQIVLGCTPDMRLMQEEIFGPVLPVVAYDTLDGAIAHIAGGPRPLALYCFGHDQAERREVLSRTHAGGVSINDWGWHVFNHDAPFGGVGNSGMGTYHGIEGFRELSHAKTVFKRHRWFPIGLFYPPYGNLVQRLALHYYLGKPDPALSAEKT